MLKVAVSLSIGTMPLEPQVVDILHELAMANVEGFVVLAGHRVLDPEGSLKAESVAKLHSDRVFLAIADSGSWSAGYLTGMQKAVELGADIVISMDADGSHDPSDLPRFIDELTSRDVVLASRFMRNAQDQYPLQRRIISFMGTVLTRLFLTRYRLTDFTSGFEGLKSHVVSRIFAGYPPMNWISVTKGPYHLQNTELRLALINAGYPIHEIPIVYGKNRKGKTFGVGFLLKVLVGFFFLTKNKKKMHQAFAKKDVQKN
jgi:dolichol-phosphate mannosyltransferase